MENKYLIHFITICKHKFIVFKECCACGIVWQGIIHDLSKFTFTEFVSSAKYFQGNKSPIEHEKEILGYSKAWLNHKAHNKHHWEYWTDFSDDGSVIAYKIPSKYVIEMVCDWIGAGKVYSNDKWTQHEPLAYYNKVKKGRHFHNETEKMILHLLETIDRYGLDDFHKLCRDIKRKEMI